MRPTYTIVMVICLVLLAGCSPRFVHHPVPDLAVNTDWLGEAGCTLSRGTTFDCTPTGPLGTLGCEKVRVVDLYGGLSPSDPLVECDNYTGELAYRTGFSAGGCSIPYLTTHVMFKDNAYHLVGRAEVRALFAPIESADEALSYALAATDRQAIYGGKAERFYKYLAREIEDTHVDETSEGYLVHLFAPMDPRCGCGVHTVDAVDLLVMRDGQIRTVASQPVYEFDACID